MSCGLASVFRYQGFQLRLGPVMVERGRTGQPIEVCKLGPSVGAAHVNGPDRFDPWPRRVDAEEARGLAALDTAPEFSLRRQQEVLVERIGRNAHFHPFAAPS